MRAREKAFERCIEHILNNSVERWRNDYISWYNMMKSNAYHAWELTLENADLLSSKNQVPMELQYYQFKVDYSGDDE